MPKSFYETRRVFEGTELPNGIVHEIMVARTDDEGLLYEFGLRWHDLNRPRSPILRIEIFNGSFTAFRDMPELFNELALIDDRDITVEDARQLLLHLGFVEGCYQ